MRKQFKPGDPVKLRTGNKIMHVEGYDEQGRVICIAEDGQRIPYPESALETVHRDGPTIGKPRMPSLLDRDRRRFGDIGGM